MHYYGSLGVPRSQMVKYLHKCYSYFSIRTMCSIISLIYQVINICIFISACRIVISKKFAVMSISQFKFIEFTSLRFNVTNFGKTQSSIQHKYIDFQCSVFDQCFVRSTRHRPIRISYMCINLVFLVIFVQLILTPSFFIITYIVYFIYYRKRRKNTQHDSYHHHIICITNYISI